MNWYMVQVVNGREARVAKNIREALDGMGVTVLVPMTKKTNSRTRGRTRILWRKTRPGYVFIKCEMREEILDALGRVRGVGAVDSEKCVPRAMSSNAVKLLEQEFVAPEYLGGLRNRGHGRGKARVIGAGSIGRRPREV